MDVPIQFVPKHTSTQHILPPLTISQSLGPLRSLNLLVLLNFLILLIVLGQSCTSAGTEEAVSFSQSNFASDGGFSVIAQAPAFQKAAIVTYFKSGVRLPPNTYYNRAGRGFPDVSALGSAILIETGGNIEAVGGTSASSPIFAGVVGLLNDYVNTKTGKPLGFVSPLLYKMVTKRPSVFFDVIKGDNICKEDSCSSGCQDFYAVKG
eukprot:TRINITY_DN1623_c0_g2_i5.p1 TRINITY_DN1623_c0_g2~~TRINITY_DN1623_c0_g2_i5.p1  ORF type:complete len:207 (-),score=35.07 TRINITY_DN1623_c0_g2_i5:492-1112(-)